MSTDPSVLALGQLFELCKRHPNVVHLLVSNPIALDALSKYPEQALAALNGLDAAQDIDEPETPYGLNSMGTADMLARVRTFKALDVSYRLSDALYAHDVVHRTFGGRQHYLRVPCPPQQAEETGYAAMMFMRGPHQPYMPDSAGALGVLLSAMPRLECWPSFENVFVSQTKDYSERHLHAADWRYAGRYELRECRSLDTDEVMSLPEETFEHWAVYISRRHGDSYLVRLRARVYLSVIDDLENITEADITRCIAEHGDEVIKTAIRASDVKDALRDGTITLCAFVMRPVGYDVGVPLLLEKTREIMEAEEEAEDAIEVVSEPPRGTKRKTPDFTRTEYSRAGFGPSASMPPRPRDVGPSLLMPRPKRSTVKAGVNYCEDDSEYDFELARPAGPVASGSQPRRVVQ